jgi:hypothetical protein
MCATTGSTTTTRSPAPATADRGLGLADTGRAPGIHDRDDAPGSSDGPGARRDRRHAQRGCQWPDEHERRRRSRARGRASACCCRASSAAPSIAFRSRRAPATATPRKTATRSAGHGTDQQVTGLRAAAAGVLQRLCQRPGAERRDRRRRHPVLRSPGVPYERHRLGPGGQQPDEHPLAGEFQSHAAAADRSRPQARIEYGNYAAALFALVILYLLWRLQRGRRELKLAEVMAR